MSAELKEWCVDWEVQVDISLTKTVTYNATEIIEATTAEEAVQKAKDEMDVGADELDISGQVEPEDFQVETVQLDTFKVNGAVQEFTT